MQDDDVLADQPAVRSILDKRSSKRKNGRKDVEYLVEFTGLPKSEAAWYAAKNVRNRMEHGASIVAAFEAGLKAKPATKIQQHPAMALPMTQEPFFTEVQEASTQDVDLNLSSLFNARDSSMFGSPAAGKSASQQPEPYGAARNSSKHQAQMLASMGAASRGRNADPELRPASPKRRRLSHSPGTLPMPVKARLAASFSPWVDEFDDCDSLFPPLAPIPGIPRYRQFAVPADARQAGISGSSPVARTSPGGTNVHVGLHTSSPLSGQARQAAKSPAQGVPVSAAKQYSQDYRLSPSPQQLDRSAQHQPAPSESSLEASSASDDSAEEAAAASTAQNRAASRPMTRAQAMEANGVAEQEEIGERNKDGQAAEESGGQQEDAAAKGADVESESWHSLQEERAAPGGSHKAVPPTPQSQHLPRKQNAPLHTPPSQRLSAKPANAVGISTPVPIEPATGAHCKPRPGEAARRSVPASLQEGFLWSPDQAERWSGISPRSASGKVSSPSPKDSHPAREAGQDPRCPPSKSADDACGAAPVSESSLMWLALKQCQQGKGPRTKPAQNTTAKSSEAQQPPVQKQKSPEVHPGTSAAQPAEATEKPSTLPGASQAEQVSAKAVHTPTPQGGHHKADIPAAQSNRSEATAGNPWAAWAKYCQQMQGAGRQSEQVEPAASYEKVAPARTVAEAVVQRRRGTQKPIPAEQLASQSNPSSSPAPSPEPVRISSSSDEDEPAEASVSREDNEGVQTRSKGLQKEQKGAEALPDDEDEVKEDETASAGHLEKERASPDKSAGAGENVEGADIEAPSGPDWRAYLSLASWEQASIIGGRHVDGGMDLHVSWPDGYHAWIFNQHLKERPHCLLKLITFYESKTRSKKARP